MIVLIILINSINFVLFRLIGVGHLLQLMPIHFMIHLSDGNSLGSVMLVKSNLEKGNSFLNVFFY